MSSQAKTDRAVQYHFGSFRLESDTGRLYRGSEDVAVPPRVINLLECLLARPGEVVSKEDLLEAVWAETHVGEESLAQAVSVLRQALGDDPKVPRYLETIPRRGYRFIELVTSKRDGPEPEVPQSTVKTTGRRRTWLRFVFLVAALLLVAILATQGWFRQSSPARLGDQTPLTQEVDSANRVVVAVFENQTGDPDLDPIGRMASDLVAQGLQRTGFVDVVPPANALHASRAIRNRSDRSETGADGEPVDALARATGAGLAVAGAYYRQGDSVQFNAQITEVTDSRSGRLISSVETVSGPIDQPTVAVEALRQRVMGALASILDPRIEQPAEAMGHLPSYDAYKAFIEGLEIFWRGGYLESVHHFERAIELDPDYQMSRILSVFAYDNAGERAQAEPLLRELELRRRELSPYEGYRLDQLQAAWRGDLEGAHRAALSAAKISPEFGPVMDAGLLAAWLNRPQEAVAALLTIDTKQVLIGWTRYWEELTAARHVMGDHAEELEDARRGRSQYPESIEVLFCEARAQAALGETRKVRELTDRLPDLTPQGGWTPGVVLLQVGLELEAHGHPEAAQETLDSAIRWYENLPAAKKEEQWFDLAETLFAAGRVDEASRILEGRAPEDSDQIHPVEDVFYFGALGVMWARQGQREEAQQLAARLETMNVAYAFGWPSLWRARIAASLGDSEQAVVLLRRSFAEGAGRGTWLHRDPYLEPMRDYKPFQDLLRPAG